MAIVQARMTSTRFPGKVLAKFPDGKPVIHHVVTRIAQAGIVPVVAMPTGKGQNALSEWCQNNHIQWIAPECKEDDVLTRYFLAATYFNAKAILRVTCDCPAVSPSLIKELVKGFKEANGAYYFGLDVPHTIPDGLDAEIFSYRHLRRAFAEANSLYDREHVTPWMKRKEVYIRIGTGFNFRGIKFSVDEPEDMGRAWEWMTKIG